MANASRNRHGSTKYLSDRRAIIPNIETGAYPFKGVKLSRADVEWLLATHEEGRGPVAWAELRDLTRYERSSVRTHPDFRGAILVGENLRHLSLAYMLGGLTQREWTNATSKQREDAAIHLEGADLFEAHLEGISLRGAHLEGAALRQAFLESAMLTEAHLEGADLQFAHLERAGLIKTYMGGRCLSSTERKFVSQWSIDFPEVLLSTDLRYVSFNNRSSLIDPVVTQDKRYGSVQLAGVHWNDVGLSGIDWGSIRILGDEYQARQRVSTGQLVKDAHTRLDDYRRAARAYRKLSLALRSQGLTDEADKFAFRAQKVQRQVSRWQRQWLRYLGSLFLDLISGYGYKPMRSLIAYLMVVGAFVLTYYLLGNNVHPPLDPLGAVVFSITSFHGRGFAPGENVPITNPVTVLAAFEAVIGLLIEITFIATFTQRFFAR